MHLEAVVQLHVKQNTISSSLTEFYLNMKRPFVFHSVCESVYTSRRMWDNRVEYNMRVSARARIQLCLVQRRVKAKRT